MEHVSLEALARLVDEPPTAEEAAHLDGCPTCAAELEALRLQTEELGSIPALRPPGGDWDVLEARLRSEGLVEGPDLLNRFGLAHTPGWMRAAAAVLLFLGGTALGTALDGGPVLPGAPATDAASTRYAANAGSVEDAAAAVRAAEQSYVDALTRYRQLLAREGTEDGVGDPASRFAALEYLVAASQAAVRQAPADPFLNGLLASTLAEREATLQAISSNRDNWF